MKRRSAKYLGEVVEPCPRRSGTSPSSATSTPWRAGSTRPCSAGRPRPTRARSARLRERHPGIHVLQRPSTRPFAGISPHDPAGNVFDLSQKDMQNRTSVYVESPREQARSISHLALRTLNVDQVAEFYVDSFELEPLEKKSGDPNHYLSDGRVTLR